MLAGRTYVHGLICYQGARSGPTNLLDEFAGCYGAVSHLLRMTARQSALDGR
jgi:hypothetical protein